MLHMSCTMQLLNICVYTKSYLKILAQLNISNILHHIALSCIHLCITIWWWCWTLKQWNICFWKIRKHYVYLLCPCTPILTEGLVDPCWIFLLFSFEFTLLNTSRLQYLVCTQSPRNFHNIKTHSSVPCGPRSRCATPMSILTRRTITQFSCKCNFVLFVRNQAIFAVEMPSTVSTLHSYTVNHARHLNLA